MRFFLSGEPSRGRSIVRKARGGQSGGRNVSKFYFRTKRDKSYLLRFIVSPALN